MSKQWRDKLHSYVCNYVLFLFFLSAVFWVKKRTCSLFIYEHTHTHTHTPTPPTPTTHTHTHTHTHLHTRTAPFFPAPAVSCCSHVVYCIILPFSFRFYPSHQQLDTSTQPMSVCVHISFSLSLSLSLSLLLCM